jgi:2,4-dienoyl-CoA reductase-like NADH-dependent reductase (Old Yellow Enzyme family)
MSLLFTHKKIGNLELPNRFVRSATYEGLAKETGEVSDELIKGYERLAKGDISLIITGHMFVHSSGKANKYQTGIHSDEMISGLKKITETVQRNGGKIAFQLSHGGRQTTKDLIGQAPIGPSSKGRDPLYFVKPREMTEDDIQEIIRSFGAAAKRAVVSGADGIQIHAGHGFLINEFLSPFYNYRADSWGGSDENRFRFLKEVVEEVKTIVPAGFPILIKINAYDHTPKRGITLSQATRYAAWLAALGVDGVELSCGTMYYSYMNLCRGDVPINELLKSLPWWQKPLGRLMLGKLKGKYDLKEGYNLEDTKMIKSALGNTPLFLVGGMRTVAQMEYVLENDYADFISMSRPFIR